LERIVIKNLIKACALIAGLFAVTETSAQQNNFNEIATAYLTTTISQSVVFDSTMQAGGDFTFSVLAHNGGGRAGQSDTANVKIEFYTSSNALVTSASTSYSGNLPNPNAACGNPCIDSAVPWTTLSITKTLTAAQAATVSYAKVYFYGIDGSYWAGDYGPWYRAPTLSLNNGGNLLYNPEFGPYNNVQAQGWNISPALGACQGAWGGSNACIVNSSGQPGQSTVGLVANANGGGPSATGGTTSGTPGGYNSTMSTSNPAGGTPTPPAGPTVVSTVTTNQTRTVIVGNQSQTVTTPVTVTTYSDGSTTTTNGTATTTTNSTTAFTGVHFGPSQVADTQWNVTACTTTNSCQIYSTSPGITYNTQSSVTVGANQYITFIPNTGSDSSTYPWTMILVNADGTYTSLGSCKVDVQGVDSNGYIYLFVQNANMNGTLFSANLGLTGQGMTFTGIQNPTVSDTNTAAANMSSTPLAAGQTGGTVVPPGPQAVNVATGTTGTNPAGTTTLAVTNAGTYTNNGTNGDVNNSGSFTNNGTTGDVTNSGDFTNNGTNGNVNNSGTFTNAGTTGDVTNTGSFTNNSGATTGAVANQTGSTFTNNGTTGTVTNDGTFTNNSGGVTGAVTNNSTGVFDNTGTTGAVTNAGTFTNNSGGVTGAVSNSGTFTNNGTTGAFNNTGTLTNGGTIASLVNSGTASNSGTITGTVTNTAGTFTNSGTTGNWTNNASINNSGTMGNGTNNTGATFTNSGTVGTVTNAGTFNNHGGITGAVTNSGTFTNWISSIIASLTNTGTASNAGTVTGTVTNSAGTFTNTGTTGDWNNSAAINNSGNMGNGTNSGTFVQTAGSVGNVTNTGTFGYIAGTMHGMTNSGTLSVTSANGPVAMSSFAQTNTGTTWLNLTPNSLQQINVSGAATLGGTVALSAEQGPYHIGSMTLLTANSVSGTFSNMLISPDYVSPLNPKLIYSQTAVKMVFSPSTTDTQTSINAVAADRKTALGTHASVLGNGLGGDCGSTGAMGGCMTVNLGRSNAGSNDLTTAGTSVVKYLDANWRAGVTIAKPLGDAKAETVTEKYNPVMGGLIGWKQNTDGTGLDITASVAKNDGTITLNRQGNGVVSEPGTGSSKVTGQAAQIRAGYTIPVAAGTNLTPYVGVRRTFISAGGYTETGNIFPLTVKGAKQTNVDVIAGVGVAHKLTDDITITGSIGVNKTVDSSKAGFAGTSDIGHLETFTAPKGKNKTTSVSMGTGISYQFMPGQTVGANIGWSQKSLTSAGGLNFGVSYSLGF
jgi:hypothetical protein